MRDGLVVFQWAVLFWYERVLRDVSHETRLALDASASAAVAGNLGRHRKS